MPVSNGGQQAEEQLRAQVVEAVVDAVVAAVEHGRVIRLHYRKDGPMAGSRTVYPHVVYRGRTGRTCLEGVQVDGPTQPDLELPGWRQFDLAKVDLVEQTGAMFARDAAFNQVAYSGCQVLAMVARPERGGKGG